MSLEGKTIRARIDRILELPPLLDAEGKKLAGLRADRRKQERKIAAHEALLRKELMDLAEYQACNNNDERAALVAWSKHADPTWESLTERLEALLAMIDHSTNRKEVLDHERKALKAALEREYAAVIEAVHQDQALVKGIAGRFAA